MPLRIVGVPTARYDGNAIEASDDQGKLSLVAEDEPETPIGINRHWKATRDTSGDVRLVYRAPPRQVTAATNNGPLFDLRFESWAVSWALELVSSRHPRLRAPTMCAYHGISRGSQPDLAACGLLAKAPSKSISLRSSCLQLLRRGTPQKHTSRGQREVCRVLADGSPLLRGRVGSV